ncbi:MAG: ABC transporter permease [Verrucomicrobiae bacterium]|nr:ABC transporter permease [Verrucomicrobiae bacterium]NNJ41815.1 ABC transporter permease subunit [Akkermansiaceae bacterium]
MKGRVALALVWHEFLERSRDRWILVLTMLFVLLSGGITMYGKAGGLTQGEVVGPSLVTLSSLLIPLVGLLLGFDAVVGERERRTLNLLLSMPMNRWEFILAKFIGRFIPLAMAILAGILTAVFLIEASFGAALIQLIIPSLLLGATFLAVGIMISSLVVRQATASSLLITVWFLLVFFYDLAVLGALVVTDGAMSNSLTTAIVVSNPVGLFRITMMQRFGGDNFLAGFGLESYIPGEGMSALIWLAWVLIPLTLSVLFLYLRRQRS